MSHPAKVAIGEHADPKPTRRMGMRGSPGLTLLSAALGVMMVGVDGTIVAVANPAIQTKLGASLADIQWVTNGYLLALAVTLVTVGKFGDRFGHRKVFLTGIVGFAVTSAAAGPIVGGLLVQHINWEACFYVNVPVGHHRPGHRAARAA